MRIEQEIRSQIRNKVKKALGKPKKERSEYQEFISQCMREKGGGKDAMKACAVEWRKKTGHSIDSKKSTNLDNNDKNDEEFCSVCEILKMSCEFVNDTEWCKKVTEEYLSKKITPEEHEESMMKKYGDKYIDAVNKANVVVARNLGYDDEEIKTLLKDKGLDDPKISELLRTST
ncbi:MAG: hypothetical protein DRN25_02385 [Thermoplasmata archaeon]|nr:MAG: hypothetical protein DRN25_02385 [Thermoplasmata archaeon]